MATKSKVVMKSLECVKHEQGGSSDNGGLQGDQSDLYESEVENEAESRGASHMLNTSEGEGAQRGGSCTR